MENKAFNSDPVVCREINRLRDLFGVKCSIETGSYEGNTTHFLGQNFEEVYSIELSDEFYNKSRNRCSGMQNVNIIKSSSEKELSTLLPKLKEKHDKALFYLDAHWDNYWPLQDELTEISKTYKDNCIIVIDDFFVPNRNFQFDTYHSQPCNLEFVQKELESCFGEDGFTFYYLNKSERKLPIRDCSIGGVGKLYAVPNKLMKGMGVSFDSLCFEENGSNYSNVE